VGIRPLVRRLTLMIVAAMAIGGCGSSDAPERTTAAHDLRFEFKLLAGENQIDQTVTIENPGDTSLAPVLGYTPLDAAGEPMPDIQVKTAYGSDSGRLVVPAEWAVLDVLRFEGPGARKVENVDVRVREADEVAIERPTEEAEIQRLDKGRPVEYAHLFDSFRLTNRGDAEIDVRVALIEYELPPEGESQQWVRVTELAPLTTLAAGGKKTIRLPRPLRGRVIGSVKPYFSR
jgi:hypothetical protein